MIARVSAAKAAAASGFALLLAGCVSFGPEPPENLFTLTPDNRVAQGASAMAASGAGEGPIAVLTPETPARLDVTRIPVTVTDTQIAYLQDAHWVEKPARLFRQLLGETLRSRTAGGGDTGILVLDTDDTPVVATRFLRGTLLDMTYDAATSSVIVRFDALHTMDDGSVASRRFEAREDGVLPEAAAVGPALNRVANSVAQDVADWVIAAG
ncbi:ABC-type transport auxiliary lipoprotein family protein [Erythrobacter sp.]|jgi:cholesterol transport system auxiliary component|uniref:ABC-type transport auxiliary lipoprotein family protein n=1 Tax=Erythrobacter sp. TaxID=1042 RepID=UPI002EB1791B|nr:ABC-type transport auxiliary lipoprotein family protein [Erythrobacter sp.]